MPRCKKSDCREEAVPFGKRYCPTHMAEYKRKQREYEEVRKTLRNCECCGDTLTKTKHDAGETLCWSCDEKRIEQTEIEIMDELLAVNRERGTTLVLVTHNLALAEQAEQIVHIAGGGIVA